ncbi:hypothetical protein QJS10_CPA01g00968 [Acorus calamus]|uniref:Uncharacterized protein n=1 Tax=Acorus calamus TaxID=4465 RepID=A0AAV9FI19_ACOCL|nr:hypothetical protein QJS10_CPA01g00968 [Acorus calamus]
MAEEGIGEEEMAKTEVHHHPSMPDAKDHFDLLLDPFLFTVLTWSPTANLHLLLPLLHLPTFTPRPSPPGTLSLTYKHPLQAPIATPPPDLPPPPSPSAGLPGFGLPTMLVLEVD